MELSSFFTSSSLDWGHCFLLSFVQGEIGVEPFLAFFILDLFTTLSTCVLLLSLIRRLDLSLYIYLCPIYIKLHLSLLFQRSYNCVKKRYIISNELSCHPHTRLEILLTHLVSCKHKLLIRSWWSKCLWLSNSKTYRPRSNHSYLRSLIVRLVAHASQIDLNHAACLAPCTERPKSYGRLLRKLTPVHPRELGQLVPFSWPAQPRGD
jgi:hypothetical protein